MVDDDCGETLLEVFRCRLIMAVRAVEILGLDEFLRLCRNRRRFSCSLPDGSHFKMEFECRRSLVVCDTRRNMIYRNSIPIKRKRGYGGRTHRRGYTH